MKSPLYLFLFACTLSLFSCQKESDDALSSTYFIENELQSKQQLSTEDATFERRMQWAAFIAAKALINDNASQLELSNIISGNNKVISLAALLVQDAAPNFKSQFSALLIDYLSDELVPEFEKDKPGRPIYGGCRGELDQKQIIDKAKAFVDYLVLENCTEFYFPLGLNDITQKTFISTAHPLTSSSSNIGYERYHEPIVVDDLPTITLKVLVSPENLLEAVANIVVARPLRVPFNSVCEYEEYMGIEFPDFLAN